MKNIATHQVPAWRHRANFLIRADLANHGMPGRLEQLWARRVEANIFEICCIPFFTYGFALGDLVETCGEYTFQRVVEKRGHTVLRAAVARREKRNELHQILHAWVEDTGLLSEWFSPRYLAVDLPAEAQNLSRKSDLMISSLEKLFRSGEMVIELDR